MTTVICCRGISEPQWPQRNMLSYFVDALPANWLRIDIPYSASYGPANADHNLLAESFDSALAGAYELLDRAIRNADDRVVLAGYSAGAGAVGNLLARNRYLNVAAVVLVADPFQPGGAMHGIAGSRTVPGYNVRWVSDPKDVICCCPDDSPLRQIADVTAALSFGDVPGWGADLLDRLVHDRWQAVAAQWWNPVGEWRRWQAAIDGAAGYLGAGQVCQHTTYSWARAGSSTAGSPTWLQEAAAWAARQ